MACFQHNWSMAKGLAYRIQPRNWHATVSVYVKELRDFECLIYVKFLYYPSQQRNENSLIINMTYLYTDLCNQVLNFRVESICVFTRSMDTLMRLAGNNAVYSLLKSLQDSHV